MSGRTVNSVVPSLVLIAVVVHSVRTTRPCSHGAHEAHVHLCLSLSISVFLSSPDRVSGSQTLILWMPILGMFIAGAVIASQYNQRDTVNNHLVPSPSGCQLTNWRVDLEARCGTLLLPRLVQRAETGWFGVARSLWQDDHCVHEVLRNLAVPRD
jgi:hypothetical protein